MSATAEQILAVREWTGDEPDELTITATWDRTGGTVASTALSVLRLRRSLLLADPAKLSTDGEFSEDWTANLAALDRDIARLSGIVAAATAEAGPDVGVATVAHFYRCDRVR